MAIKPSDEESGVSPGLWDRMTGRKTLAAVTFASLLVGIFAVVSPLIPWSNWAIFGREPGITFEIVSEADVLDLYRPVDDLDIEFQGKDLQEQNLNLRIITLNVQNSGGTHIRINDYDDNDWGIQFQDSDVIEARRIEASAEYLASDLSLTPSRPGFVGLPKTIFDQGDSYTIEVLLLHPERLEPILRPIGKIAGVEGVQIKDRPAQADEDPSVMDSLLKTSRRVAFYVVGFVAGYWVLPKLFDWVMALTRTIRNKPLLRAQTIGQMKQDGTRNALTGLCVSGGEAGLRSLYAYIHEPCSIRWFTPPARWTADDSRNYGNRWNSRRAWSALMEMDVLTRGEDDVAVVDPTFIGVVENLMDEVGMDKLGR